jgi:signal transduction histidine kinase
MRRAAIAVGISGLATVAGVFSLDTARDDPAFWFAGTSDTAGVALLVAGWALVACGLAFWTRRPASRFGPLLPAAGFAWFLLEWNNAGIGSSLAFTVGLCLYVACPPLVAHAALAYPSGRLSSNAERGVLVIAYVGSLVVLGVLPALLFDPEAQGCTQCPRNLLQVADSADAVSELNRLGVYLGLAWALALAVLLSMKLARRSRASLQASGPVLAAGVAYVTLVAAFFAVSLEDGLLSSGTLERRIWFGQGVALVAITLGVGWSWIRGRRARDSVARLVVELAQSRPPGGLRESLAAIVGDPELALAYPLADSGRLVDADGQPVELSNGRARTTLVRDGRAVAVLEHAPGLLDDEQLVDDVTAAARLALENERLQAEVRARLEELRGSRARIVEAGDAERKRLERDLHDGAQQRLVALSLSLRLLRTQLPADAPPQTLARLDEAEVGLRTAIAELRELAHGIFPAVLADEGLAAAVEALAEEASIPVRIRRLPGGRFASRVETAAYTVVAELAQAAASSVVVRGERTGDILAVEVETEDRRDGLELLGLEDRVRALDGRLTVQPGSDGRVTIRAELPCGS